MDALVVVIAGLLLAPLIALGLGVTIATLGTLAGGMHLATRWDSPWRRIFTRAQRYAIRVTIAGALAAAAVDLFFFETTMRWVCERIESTSGTSVAFERARGSLYGGNLVLEGLRVERRGDPQRDFELEVEHLGVEVRMLGLLAERIPVEHVDVRGVHGRLTRHDAPSTAQRAKRARTLRAFEIESLRLDAVDLELEDQASDPQLNLALLIDHFESGPLRSDFALFDLLYESEGEGALAGHRFAVDTRAIEGGREAHWQVQAIELSELAPHLGAAGPLLAGGRVELEVVDRYYPDRSPPGAQLEVSARLEGVELGGGKSAKARALLAAAGPLLERLGPQPSLDFSFELPEERTRDARSLADLGLWESALGAGAAALTKKAGLGPAELRGLMGVAAALKD